MIRRRHVFYVEGYDPQGAGGYYDLFAGSFKRCSRVWSFEGKLGELALDSDLLAHWDVHAAGPNWQVTTRYEFLRLEGALRANLAQPLWRQLGYAFKCLLVDVVSGTALRIFRASWRFELHLFGCQFLLSLWFVLPLLAGAVAARAAAGLGNLAAFAIAIATVIAGIALLRPLVDRWLLLRMNNCWPYLHELARGDASCFDEPIEACAARIVAAARGGAADEIVIVGHSAGGAIAPVVLTRALQLDPDIGRHGPRLLLLTVGSLLPAAALRPAAHRIREVIARLVIEPSITWIDCVSRKDIMNFWGFDLVAGMGVKLAAPCRNPSTWAIRFRDMVSPEHYRSLRSSFFRLHFQFIISGDRRAPYDYLMLVTGPAAIEAWARHPGAVAAAFAPDGTFALPAVGAAGGVEAAAPG